MAKPFFKLYNLHTLGHCMLSATWPVISEYGETLDKNTLEGVSFVRENWRNNFKPKKHR